MKNTVILIADDDAEDQFMVSNSFSDIGVTIDIAFCENGIEVLDYLKQAREQDRLPSLIILDLNMPKMTGKEAMIVIKQHKEYRNIPVIIFSTLGVEQIKEECIHLGAMNYLTKPTDYQQSLQLARYFHDIAVTGHSAAFQ